MWVERARGVSVCIYVHLPVRARALIYGKHRESSACAFHYVYSGYI